MATALTIIRRALRLVRVIDAGEVPTAGDSADALETLNALLAEWHEAEIGLPDYSFATINATTTLDAADREAVAHQLAIRIAPEYGHVPSPVVAKNASDSWARMALRYFQPGTADLSELPGESSAFNFATGE
jgi:hypothetical protein